MRRDSSIAVITATLVAIGVALGATVSVGAPNQIDDFEQIIYVQNVEHGQLALLGDCPLGREIVVERTGKVRISWYAQKPDHHGCVRATGFDPEVDEEYLWDEPKVAHIDQMLNPADLDRLVEELEGLAWDIEWKAPGELDYTYSTGCDRPMFSFPDRLLLVAKSESRPAILSVFGEKPGDKTSCIANEIGNKVRLDAAFASLAPLLPKRYDLRPEVARRLYRKE